MQSAQRVMERYFYVLQRFFLLVDNVQFKLNETRVYHSFGSSYVYREYTSREEAYDTIKAVSRLLCGLS
jgi:type 2A phosphatase activator TIP41